MGLSDKDIVALSGGHTLVHNIITLFHIHVYSKHVCFLVLKG
jgi:hypothetical protein